MEALGEGVEAVDSGCSEWSDWALHELRFVKVEST